MSEICETCEKAGVDDPGLHCSTRCASGVKLETCVTCDGWYLPPWRWEGHECPDCVRRGVQVAMAVANK